MHSKNYNRQFVLSADLEASARLREKIFILMKNYLSQSTDHKQGPLSVSLACFLERHQHQRRVDFFKGFAKGIVKKTLPRPLIQKISAWQNNHRRLKKVFGAA